MQVKVLGVLGLIDEGETDWKVIVIDITDPVAGQLNGKKEKQNVKKRKTRLLLSDFFCRCC
jgi:inorganic pyrophosphatase